MNAGRLVVVLCIPLWLAGACSPGETIQGGTGAAGPTSTTDGPTDDGAPSTSPSTTAGVGGAAGNGGAGGCTLESPNTCETAEALPDIDGDINNDQAMVKGTGSKWFQIKLVEASSGPVVVKYIATLVSAPGTDYDLYMRRGDASGPDCSFTPLQAMGMPETISQCFPEMGGSDDSRYLSFEIVHISGGTCDEAAQWTLTVEGNEPPGPGCP